MYINNVQDIVCFDGSVFLILKNGDVLASGENDKGQLGLGTTKNVTEFTKIPDLHNVKQISINNSYSYNNGNPLVDYNIFALLENGDVMVYGYTNDSEYAYSGLFNNTKVGFSKVPNVSNVKRMINVYNDKTFLILENNTVMGYGTNNNNSLGLDGKKYTSFTQIPSLSGTSIKNISGYYTYTCVLLNDGSIMVAGNNSDGQLGFGETNNINTFTKVSGITNVTDIACDGYATFLVLSDGTVMCAGDSRYGRFGNGSDSSINIKSFQKISGLNNVKQFYTTKNYNSLALLKNGDVMVCGKDDYSLGYHYNDRITTFQKVPNVSNVIQIIPQEDDTFLILSDGTVMCAGENYAGELGLPYKHSVGKFTKIPTIGNVKKIVVGRTSINEHTDNNYTFILLEDNRVLSCGLNNCGQLGLGDTDNVEMFNLVSYNDSYTINNILNDIGIFKNDINTTINKILEKLNEKPKPNPTDIKQVSCGNEHTVILYNNNTMKVAGSNGRGQLGLGDNSDRNVFTKI